MHASNPRFNNPSIEWLMNKRKLSGTFLSFYWKPDKKIHTFINQEIWYHIFFPFLHFLNNQTEIFCFIKHNIIKQKLKKKIIFLYFSFTFSTNKLKLPNSHQPKQWCWVTNFFKSLSYKHPPIPPPTSHVSDPCGSCRQITYWYIIR